ncbi:hypothetical protein GCM10011584_14270 [Nocardioides phosphati]|uniref:Uncharacterized protein n=1 Tax=Nocardioides phosphati TaxID=1867775 RepID=A0ABQ2NAM0_9ACTN|nr:hypothetical protein [Nocardioides phosphati]GGO88085.1 hypothetical protein GCM10011584_14270 [Nocardioides phosphati]
MANDLVLNRLTPPGDQFTLVTLRVLDEKPDVEALTKWYRTHLHQVVVVNRLEGTQDFAFSAAPPTAEEVDALVARLASTEHDLDLSGRTAEVTQTEDAPFGPGSWISGRGYDLGGGQWLSVLFGTLTWPTVLADA